MQQKDSFTFWRLSCLAITACLIGCSGSISDSNEPKPLGETPSEGEPVVADAPAEGACSHPVRDPGPIVARRLTRWEYVNSLRDTLGIDLGAEAAALPLELRTAGFYNTANNLLPTLERVTVFSDLAAKASAKISNFNAFVAGFTSCRTFGDTCEIEFVRRLGKALARRPLEPEEIQGFRALFEVTKTCGLAFDDGAKAVLEALLQSPQFLYRTERQFPQAGATFRALDGFELASRIAYLVTGSSPDAELMAAAEDNKLATPQARAAHVKRLLGTKPAVLAAQRFVNDWLTLDEVDTIPRDSNRFAQWNESVRGDLKEEALRMVEDVVFKQQKPLTALLTHEETFATPALAKLYGLPSQGEGWRAYDLSQVPTRKGLLTTAAVLMRSGGTADAAMVARSLFIFRNILCSDVAPPPPGTNTQEAEELKGGSKRDVADHRVADRVCGGCHQQFEPLAFAFEPFDGIGVYQEVDSEGHKTRTDGVIPGEPSQPYANTDEYLNLLAKHPEVESCMVKKPFQFAIGRALDGVDECTIADLQRALQRTDGSYQEFLLTLVQHPVFAFVRRE